VSAASDAIVVATPRVSAQQNSTAHDVQAHEKIQ
jgi:hypothetical protein